MFRRFFDEGLAQNSYLLWCERTRQAVVVDPRRDADAYCDAAATGQLSIAFAIDTHIHADFISGARELAAAGAVPAAGPGASLGFPHHQAADGSTLTVGDIRLTFLHTPGHTPEHISILAESPGSPVRLFTGDTLFAGAVGRPDLLGQAAMRELAGQLYDSLFERLLPLEDDVEVHPGHGAGSLCGAGIRNEPHTTIGRERRFNPLLQHRDRDAFVTAVLSDLPDTPPYFARMKQVNREGPVVLDLVRGVAAPAAIAPVRAAEAMAAGAWLLDVRAPQLFAAGHAEGAVSMAFGPQLEYWAAWILPPGARVVLMTDGGAGQAAGVRRQLLRVGLERIDGWIEGGFEAWRASGLPIRRTTRIAAADLRHHAAGTLTIVDVRTAREWQSGHVPGAVHVPLGELLARAPAIPRDRPLATICEGGYRSNLAASLLERIGIEPVVNIADGMSAWRALEART